MLPKVFRDVLAGGNRERLALLFIFAGAAVMVCVIDRSPMHLQSRFPEVQIQEEFQVYLDGVVNKTLPGPYVYRILIPYLVFFLHERMPFISALMFDFLLKIFILVFCQFVFFSYLRYFFSGMAALAGVLWLDLLIGFSLFHIQGPSLVETADLMNVLIFSLALRAIYRDQFVWLCLILLAGTLNRETTWILLPVLFFNDRIQHRPWHRLFSAGFIIAGCYFGVRWLVETSNPTWFTTQDIGHNIPFLSPRHTLGAFVANLHLAFLLGPLILIGIYRFPKHPLFLRIAASIAPLFILIHYVVGSIREIRLWMPLYLLLIPLAINNLTGFLQNESDSINR